MYEAMIRRVAQRCEEDMDSKDLVRIAHGFASAVEILSTVQNSMQKPIEWVIESCIYRMYMAKLEHNWVGVQDLDLPIKMKELNDISSGRSHLP